eukprot:CAMPEP_0194445900 /NCGR_PEP_ID=MMETSP0176-20130528/128123_1 /TAXON_ID=216777 /ORGANISM="Proboscia alata, Strain PI-D3" /LENGTH=806 /DNA_ID=CAMNT_0039272525 /DNA_START=73 /DNA_END=2493 /DNA_ORIENTATION=-
MAQQHNDLNVYDGRCFRDDGADYDRVDYCLKGSFANHKNCTKALSEMAPLAQVANETNKFYNAPPASASVMNSSHKHTFNEMYTRGQSVNHYRDTSDGFKYSSTTAEVGLEEKAKFNTIHVTAAENSSPEEAPTINISLSKKTNSYRYQHSSKALTLVNTILTKPLHSSHAPFSTSKSLKTSTSVGITSLSNNWNTMFEVLKSYHTKYGNYDVPEDFTDRKLSNWVRHQRANYKIQTKRKTSPMEASRIDALNSLGFQWSLSAQCDNDTLKTDLDVNWSKHFNDLKAYCAKYGNCLVPRRYPQNEKLGRWVDSQRQLYKKKHSGKGSASLSESRIKKFESIGFVWSVAKTWDKEWQAMFTELEKYAETNGNCLVPTIFPTNPKLGHWVNRMRKYYRQRNEGKQSTLKDNQITQLESVEGWRWTVKDYVSWDNMYDELVRFYSLHGNCSVPNKYPNNPKLANWIRHQRKFRKMQEDDKEGGSSLTSSRITRLDALGFTWKPSKVKSIQQAQQWVNMFNSLEAFHAENCHCEVTQSYDDEYPGLFSWIKQQRNLYKFMNKGARNSMTKNHVALLEQFGFRWKASSDTVSWDAMFEQLNSYYTFHGDSLVPRNYESNAKLSEWVCQLRKWYKLFQSGGKSSLNKSRIAQLDTVEFVWSFNKNEEDFSTMLKELQKYNETFGNCDVSFNFPLNQHLGRWVMEQRKSYKMRCEGKASSITTNQVTALENIGFSWSIDEWDNMFYELGRYHAWFGDCDVPQDFENQNLSKWVAEQRQNLKLHDEGKESELKMEQVNALTSLCFASATRGNDV